MRVKGREEGSKRTVRRKEVDEREVRKKEPGRGRRKKRKGIEGGVGGRKGRVEMDGGKGGERKGRISRTWIKATVTNHSLFSIQLRFSVQSK